MNTITSSGAPVASVAPVAAAVPPPPPPPPPAPTGPVASSTGTGATTPGMAHLASALGMEPTAIATALSSDTSLADLVATATQALATVTDALAVVGIIFESSL